MQRKYKNAVIAVLFTAGLIQRVSMENEISQKEMKEYTAFFDVPGTQMDKNNDVQDAIAEITGAKCQEIWLAGQTAEDAVASYIASGEYPDFISGNVALYEADALIPIDAYWEDYPNIRNYFSDENWDRLRQKDGHIYWIPQFGVVKDEAPEMLHEGEAFWIQTRVLKWAGYPDIRTVEEYFDLLEAYVKENPTSPNGEENIPFAILCDDWRYFCLENVPQFLDGYPNDGCCMVDPATHMVMDYNVTPTAKQYFQILNGAYHKGLIDPESFTQTYNEYLDKLSTGRVLGMVDQWWQFAYDVNDSLERMTEDGCGYVPLPITIDENITNQWHIKRGTELDVGTGLAVTISCEDVEGALQFVNDLMEEEVMRLRFWGIEGMDYMVDKQGVFYRTDEQRKRSRETGYVASHVCCYSYFPRIEGMLSDGINAFSPEYQQEEFLISLPKDIRACLEAYGCQNYVDMLENHESPGAWFPMYSYSDTLSLDQEAGRVWKEMEDVKKQYLPVVIMTEDFEDAWKQYMQAYEACQPEIFFAEMQEELERRLAASE